MRVIAIHFINTEQRTFATSRSSLALPRTAALWRTQPHGNSFISLLFRHKIFHIPTGFWLNVIKLCYWRALLYDGSCVGLYCLMTDVNSLVFTALHVMQTRYCDENSVYPFVCLSVRHTRELW